MTSVGALSSRNALSAPRSSIPSRTSFTVIFIFSPSRNALSAPLDICSPPLPYLVSRGYAALVEGFPESLPELAMHGDVACSFGSVLHYVLAGGVVTATHCFLVLS